MKCVICGREPLIVNSYDIHNGAAMLVLFTVCITCGKSMARGIESHFTPRCGCFTRADRTEDGGVSVSVFRCPVHTHALMIYEKLKAFRDTHPDIAAALAIIELDGYLPTLAT